MAGIVATVGACAQARSNNPTGAPWRRKTPFADCVRATMAMAALKRKRVQHPAANG